MLFDIHERVLCSLGFSWETDLNWKVAFDKVGHGDDGDSRCDVFGIKVCVVVL